MLWNTYTQKLSVDTKTITLKIYNNVVHDNPSLTTINESYYYYFLLTHWQSTTIIVNLTNNIFLSLSLSIFIFRSIYDFFQNKELVDYIQDLQERCYRLETMNNELIHKMANLMEDQSYFHHSHHSNHHVDYKRLSKWYN